eukprot:Phypoly_transcript_16824.p1 GENE.Phypoly_transcript_16824~~Phypoly_transcript_16824.p1  ORF type:complete len:206 (+),score=29.42 Phypoly_transcript_16824:86-703(+)
MSIMEYNGGAVLAMTGKNCVAIASDMRFGVQAQTLSFNFAKVFRMSEKVFLGLSGLATDIQTLHQKLVFRTNLYKLREEREISARVFGNLVATTLYEKRFGPYFSEPVIAGLEGPDNKPYITAMDLIGAPVFTEDFVMSGTCTPAMYGMCETLYRPDMSPDELFETLSQCLLASFDRDAITGWGATVHIITPEKVITKTLKGRQD